MCDIRTMAVSPRSMPRALLVGRAKAAYAEHMPRRRSFTSQLCRTARISDNITALASRNPRRIARPAKSVTLGRALGRGGFWLDPRSR